MFNDNKIIFGNAKFILKIYLKCQNLSKLQRRGKFKNWSHYVIGLNLGSLPKKLFIFIVKI
jgi:hypothetical protein